jgi:hypothetical protein
LTRNPCDTVNIDFPKDIGRIQVVKPYVFWPSAGVKAKTVFAILISNLQVGPETRSGRNESIWKVDALVVELRAAVICPRLNGTEIYIVRVVPILETAA